MFENNTGSKDMAWIEDSRTLERVPGYSMNLSSRALMPDEARTLLKRRDGHTADNEAEESRAHGQADA